MNFFEKQLIEDFIQSLTQNPDVPKEITDQIRALSETEKISKGSHFTKILEEYVPKEIANENK